MQRITKVKTINISSKIIKTLDEAIKKADALKKYLEYQLEKGGYDCLLYMCVSENDINYGTTTTGFRGKRVFEEYGLGRRIVPPHIHMIMVGNPGETIVKLIRKYFEKYKSIIQVDEIVWVDDCEDRIDDKVKYMIKQETTFRVVDKGNRNNLEPFATELRESLEKWNAAIGNPKKVFYDKK